MDALCGFRFIYLVSTFSERFVLERFANLWRQKKKEEENDRLTQGHRVGDPDRCR